MAGQAGIEIATYSMIVLALVLAFIRLVKGPGVSDRVIALDLIASITMGFIIVYAIFIDSAQYIDIVMVISLISFMGTVGISTYLKQKL